jgi:hypothetical protein
MITIKKPDKGLLSALAGAGVDVSDFTATGRAAGQSAGPQAGPQAGPPVALSRAAGPGNHPAPSCAGAAYKERPRYCTAPHNCRGGYCGKCPYNPGQNYTAIKHIKNTPETIRQAITIWIIFGVVALVWYFTMSR